MDPNRGETVYETKPVGGIPNAYDSVLKLDNVRTEHYETRFRYSTNYFINIHNYFPTMDAYDIFIRNKFPTKSTFAREGAW